MSTVDLPDAQDGQASPCKMCRRSGGVHPRDGWCSGCRMVPATHRNTYPAMVPAGLDIPAPTVKLCAGCVGSVVKHWQSMGWPAESIVTELLVAPTAADVGPALFATLATARGA